MVIKNISDFRAVKATAFETRESVTRTAVYFSVMSSISRLHILKFISAGAKDTRTIANEIGCTYENCQKHLRKLMEIGLIVKKVGVGRETIRGRHPVFLYSLNDENHFDREISGIIKSGLGYSVV